MSRTRKQAVRDVMTPEPIVLESDATVSDAARAMKERDIGDVLVSSGGRLYGIVTDRDLVVRALAEDPTRAADTPLSAICSEAIESVAPDADVGEVIALMEEKAIRRVPVVEEGRPVGIVSLGDLAVARDSESALGKISSAPPTQ